MSRKGTRQDIFKLANELDLEKGNYDPEDFTEDDEDVYSAWLAVLNIVCWEKYKCWLTTFIDDDGKFGYHVSIITSEYRADLPLKRGYEDPLSCYEEGFRAMLLKIKQDYPWKEI